ncbi:hypothetical protein PCO87_14195 [Pectobacteriaceae bacterium C52]|nr:hypothetical protein PCO87_14195 [Pectobacteriaceae bacterium C52]
MTNPEESGLERDYCAGQLSLRDLADIYGISEGAIRKRAKKHGWVRTEKKGTQKGTQVRKSGTQKASSVNPRTKQKNQFFKLKIKLIQLAQKLPARMTNGR